MCNDMRIGAVDEAYEDAEERFQRWRVEPDTPSEWYLQDLHQKDLIIHALSVRLGRMEVLLEREQHNNKVTKQVLNESLKDVLNSVQWAVNYSEEPEE